MALRGVIGHKMKACCVDPWAALRIALTAARIKSLMEMPSISCRLPPFEPRGIPECYGLVRENGATRRVAAHRPHSIKG